MFTRLSVLNEKTMNKKTLVPAVLLGILMLTAFAVPASYADASNGKAQGYTSFPGNSLYGRMHNPHFMYKWGGQEFEDMDELVEYIREYMNQWRELHQKNWKRWNTTERADVDVTTLTAQDIDEDSAVVRGKIVLDEDEYADVWFEYGTRAGSLDKKTEVARMDDEDDEIFTATLTGLNDDTRYYVRAVAKDEEGVKDYGTVVSFTTDDTDTDDDTPLATTLSARDITDDSAELRGTVDMQDFENGIVFFVYGTDEDDIDDVGDYDTYEEIAVSGDDIMKVRVDTDLDETESYTEDIDDLDDETRYYYRIGVEYENEDGDDELILGTVRTLVTR